MFRGTFEHAMDEKGRVSIPSRFREILLRMSNEGLIVTKFVLDSRPCLDVYPQTAWDKFEEELKEKPRFDEKFAKLEHFYFSNALDCVLDKQGRILLPPRLREYAGIKKEVVFSGAREKFRIWDKTIWQQLNEEAERFLVDNPQSFNILST